MKQLVLILLLCIGAGQVASAQDSDYKVLSTFLNAIVNKDENGVMNTLHPECYKDVDKLLQQSEMCGFSKWEFVGSRTTDRGLVFYIISMETNREILDKNVDFETQSRLISPSGHAFVYEVLYVRTENNKKYVVTNADMLSVVATEGALRKGGKHLPSSYYERYD